MMVQAVDLPSHRGYQAWHHAYNDKVILWLQENQDASRGQFLKYLTGIYRRPDMRQRFPQRRQILSRCPEKLRSER